jgi:hypothetical protein
MLRLSGLRAATAAFVLGFGFGVVRLLGAFAPAAPPLAVGAIALAAMGLATAFAGCASAQSLRICSPLLAAAALATNLAPFATRDAATASLAFGAASLTAMLAIFSAALGTARFRPIALGAVAVALATTAVVTFSSLYRLRIAGPMFSDFMACRLLSIEVARTIRDGEVAAILPVFVKSFSSEYSLLPALAPGLALAASAPLSRAAYQIAIAVLYAAPAYLALGWLARRIARRAGGSRGRGVALALATGFALAAAPSAMTLVTLGMPDIGGLALVVAGLFLVERIARLIALPRGREQWVERQAMRTGLQLAACLFAMFLFRRYFAFSALGLIAALGVEIALLAANRRAEFRWRAAIASGAATGLTLMALILPVLIDWLQDWRSHDYGAIYAAYNYDLAELTRRIADFFGFAIPAAALASAVFLAMRCSNHRLLRLTLVASALAFAAMLHVQSPGAHHLLLLAPALTAPIGAAALLLFDRGWRGKILAPLALAAVALTPSGSGLSRQAQLPAPRSDAAELARLRDWIDAHASPERRYCVLASSEAVSGVIVGELWQLDPVRAPTFSGAQRNNVLLPTVDGRDGPPGPAMKDCALLLVGDPVQTSLPREFQYSVALPAAEVLAGEGIGKNFRRTGEAFQLIGGVRLVAFERTAPLTDADIAALRARWDEAPRGDAARRAIERFF